MNKHHIALVLVLFISTFAFGYSGGTGTEANPYQIATKQDLLDLGANTSDYGKYFIMTADIDLAGENFTHAPIDDNISYSSFFRGTQFTGSFNGDGHIISNLTISGANFCGLFGYIGSGGVVSNLGLENASVTGTDDYIGGLCGYNMAGSIISCYSTGSVEGDCYIGGLCGYNEDGSVTACYLTGSVEGGSSVGGLCGYNKNGSIVDCYASSLVVGTRGFYGGFCGYQSGIGAIIDNCFWDINTSGIGSSGDNNYGATGKTTSEMQTLSTFTNAGWDFRDDDGDQADWEMLDNCYPMLGWQDNIAVTVPDFTGVTFEQAEILADSNNITVVVAGYLYSDYDEGLIFSQSPTSGVSTISGWGVNVYISLGTLYSGGSGTEAYPYKIATKQDLLDLSTNTDDYDKYFIMTADIDFAGETFTQALFAGDTNTDSNFDGTRFTGHFNGNGHIISNLTVSGTYYCGLFGCIGSGGAVSNLRLENVSITGTGDYVGGLCGYTNHSIIRGCFVTGNIRGTGDFVGGLCGKNYSGSISDCYVSGSFSGTGSSVGGLCGENYGNIISSYTNGSVSGIGSSVGGLCGDNYGNIISSHTNGSVSGIGSYVGGLCGDNYGNMTSCCATGFVVGEDLVGGLCGRNSSGTAKGCYATGNIFGNDSIGGLCGKNDDGNLADCYSTGDVIGTGSTIGGLCGYNHRGYNHRGSITSCYSVGSVFGNDNIGGLCGDNEDGSIGNCYYYIDAGPNNGYGVPLNDEELQQQASFAGFDFVGDDSDGSEDIWNIDSGYMPRLTWQDAPGFSPPYRLENISTSLSGSGYAADPFIISSYDDLIEFRNNSSLRIGHYSLSSDIDLTGVTYTEAFIPDTFLGTFHGNNHVISNLKIDGMGCLGFFSLLSGNVSSVGLENVSIVGSSRNVGSLCGYIYNGSITECYVTGNVTGEGSYIGGLCGYNYYGSIKSCYAASNITGPGSYIGGLCGLNYGGMADCYSSGSVTVTGHHVGGLCGENLGSISDCFVNSTIAGTKSYVGGLCGQNSGGSVGSCYTTGDVSGVFCVGGLCGQNWIGGNITECYTTGSVTGIGLDLDGWVQGGNSVGGLCGENRGGSITFCYATGSISGNNSVGGLCGSNRYGSVISCYATGSVSGADINVGGFCGYQSDSSALIENCFWDVETSGLTIGYNLDSRFPGTITNVQGITTVDMQLRETFTDAGWDFNAEIDNGTDNIWHMPFQASGYPMLYWQRDIPADITGGYGVNFEDFAALASQWMIAESEDSSGITISNDNTVDLNDLQIMAEYWLVGIY